MSTPKITLIGGPTALLEVGGFRFITDPTFDAPGKYVLPHATLTKTAGPAVAAEQVLPLDAVLLSHDQHSDNLDHSGRMLLSKAARTFTTIAGAKRLGGSVEGLASWESRTVTKSDGRDVRITAAPARHGPAGIEPLEPGRADFPHPACMGLSLSRGHHTIFVIRPFFCSTRAASILPPRPHISIAVARSGGQGRRVSAARRLVLDGREHGGRLPAIG